MRWLLGTLAVLVTACGTAGAGPGAGDPSAIPTTRGMPIATSDWEPGDAAMRALAGGVLTQDTDGCPQLDTSTRVVWPAGFTARLNPARGLELLDPNGTVVAVEGDEIEVGGGMASRAFEPDLPCVSDPTDAFIVHSGFKVLRASAQPRSTSEM